MPRIILVACVPLFLIALSVIAQTTTPKLVGSREFTATPETTSHASPPVIEGLATFTSDGTAIEGEANQTACLEYQVAFGRFPGRKAASHKAFYVYSQGELPRSAAAFFGLGSPDSS